MHIAYFSPSWPPAGAANGIVTYVQQIRDELLRLGHDVTVVSQGQAFTGDGRAVPLDWSLPFGERVIAGLARRIGRRTQRLPRGGALLARAFAQVHARHPIDVIEMEESFGWSAEVQSGLAVPVVTRLHGPHFLGQSDLETGRAARQSARRSRAEGDAIRRARFLTSPSAVLLEATLAHYGRSGAGAEVIPNPVETVAAERKWSLAECDPNQILCIGRFDRRKGADIALQAFSLVAERHPSAHLVMAGPDSTLQVDDQRLGFTEYCERYVPESVRRRVRHAGLLLPQEVQALRRRSYLTIVCSRFENFPYSIAEAMAFGCPIIATRSFGNGEMIVDGQTGWLVDVEAPQQMADAMLKVLADAASAVRAGEASWERCRTLYASPVVAEQTLAFYRTVTGQ